MIRERSETLTSQIYFFGPKLTNRGHSRVHIGHGLLITAKSTSNSSLFNSLNSERPRTDIPPCTADVYLRFSHLNQQFVTYEDGFRLAHFLLPSSWFTQHGMAGRKGTRDGWKECSGLAD